MTKTKEELEEEKQELAAANKKIEDEENRKKDLAERAAIDEKLKQEQIKTARAEAQLEAMKEFQKNQQSIQQAPQWTEQQWKDWEQETGMTRGMITTLDNIVSTKVGGVKAEFEAKLSKAEERAKIAEDRITQSEKSKTYESQKRERFAKKPQFAKYEKEFDEFLSDYPEDTKNDPVKLSKLFDRAETYIKGKVGDKEMSKENSGSHRFGTSGTEEVEETEEVDLSDLRAHERLTVEKAIRGKEDNETLKKYKHDLKGDDGVMINSKEEWDQYKVKK